MDRVYIWSNRKQPTIKFTYILFNQISRREEQHKNLKSIFDDVEYWNMKFY